MTRPTLKERQMKLREDAIRETTMRLLAEKGFEAMTMDDVANDVGISKATLYQHFRSKEELAVDVVLHTMGQIEAHIESIDPKLPAISRLREVMRWIIAKRFGEPALDFCDAESTVKPILRRHKEFMRLDSLLNGVMAGLIDAAKSEGDISPDMSTPVLVQAFLSCLQDGAYYDLLGEGRCTMQELETTLMGMISRHPCPDS
jgi:AcrR family transcriptional regulator